MIFQIDTNNPSHPGADDPVVVQALSRWWLEEVIYAPEALPQSSMLELNYREKAVERVSMLMDQTGNSLLEVVDFMKVGPEGSQLIAWATLYDDEKFPTWSGPIWAHTPPGRAIPNFYCQAE